MAIDTGLLHNLVEEFQTTDEYQIIKELVEARSMLLAENSRLVSEGKRIRAESNEARYMLRKAQTENTNARAALQEITAEAETARAELARLKESVEFLGEAAGVAAADRDAIREHARDLVNIADDLRRERDIAQESLGNLAGEYAQVRADNGDLVRLIDSMAVLANRAIHANRRLKRLCFDWWRAAEEAQEAALRYRDEDVAALVNACRVAAITMNDYGNTANWPPDMPMEYAEAINGLRTALRPFVVHVPVVGRIEDSEALGNRVAWGGGER